MSSVSGAGGFSVANSGCGFSASSPPEAQTTSEETLNGGLVWSLGIMVSRNPKILNGGLF